MTGSLMSLVAKILSYQLLIIAIVGLGFFVGGWQKAYSAWVGGFAAFIPNFYFAVRVSGSAGQEAKKVWQAFYKGEFIKLMLTAVIFVLILQIPNIEIIPLLVGYISALSVFWFALLLR